MNTAGVKRDDVRRQAEDRFAKIIKRDAEVKAYQQQQWDAEAAKVARLRALRKARDAEPRAALGKTAPARQTRPAKASRVSGSPNSKATIWTGKA